MIVGGCTGTETSPCRTCIGCSETTQEQECLGRYPKAIAWVRHEQLQQLWRSLHDRSGGQLLGAFVLSLIGYVVLVGYDFLALWFVRQKLEWWKIALTSFVSYAFSYNFGATLAGTPIRYRMYAGFKVPA